MFENENEIYDYNLDDDEYLSKTIALVNSSEKKQPTTHSRIMNLVQKFKLHNLYSMSFSQFPNVIKLLITKSIIPIKISIRIIH